MKKTPALTHAELKEAFSYCPETGEFTRLKNNKRAGVLMKIGYIQIPLGPEKFYAHRLAWFYVHGRWPNGVVDHINGDKTDNRLCNLREATHLENLANRHVTTNKYGCLGVTTQKNTKKFRSFVQIRGKRINIGYFDTIEEAADARRKVLREAFGEFAGSL